jgi:hypothetical protein
MSGLTANRQMRASQPPPQVATMPALRDQAATARGDEQRDQLSPTPGRMFMAHLHRWALPFLGLG